MFGKFTRNILHGRLFPAWAEDIEGIEGNALTRGPMVFGFALEALRIPDKRIPLHFPAVGAASTLEVSVLCCQYSRGIYAER